MTPRRLAGLGVACVAASLALFARLHVTPPSSRLDWQTRTIGHYALLDNGWAFDAATLPLAAGSAAVLAALTRARVVPGRSGAALAPGLWIAGLIGVVVFEKHNWSAGPSVSGDVHRAASVLAFLSLPVAALLAGGPALRRSAGGPSRQESTGGLPSQQRAGGPAPHRGAAVAVVVAGVAALACFSPIRWALIAEPWTGVRWWRAIPLGTAERLLGLAEVATVLLLARWAARTRPPMTVTLDTRLAARKG